MLARLFHNEMEFLSPRYHFKFGVHSKVYSGSDFWTIPIAPRALQAVEKRPSANVVLRAKVFSWLRTEKLDSHRFGQQFCSLIAEKS